MSSTESLTPHPATTATVIASLFLGTVSFMIMGIQPALLGGLVEEKRLTEAMLGGWPGPKCSRSRSPPRSDRGS